MTEGIRIERGVRIPTAQPAVTLSADLYLPAGDRPSPTLITVSPYRKDASIGIAYARRSAGSRPTATRACWSTAET